MTKTDVSTMRTVLHMLLSEESLDKTQLLTTTQANEASHRLLSSKCPKTIKFSRTLEARVHATVEHWNQGPGKAVFRQYQELGLPTTKGQLRHLQSKQDRHIWKKKYRRSPATIKHRRKYDCNLRQLLRARKEEMKTESDYHKDQLDMPDHNYTSLVSKKTNIIHYLQVTV